MKKFAAVILLLAATLLRAGDIELPAKVVGKPGSFIKVPATTKGEIVRWFAADPGLEVFPVELLKDTKTAVVTGTEPGEYRLFAYTAIAGVPSETALCFVTIEGKPKPPDPPDPPKPLPVSKLYVVIIENSAQAVATRGQYLADATLAKRFTDKGHAFRVVAQNVVGPDGQPPTDVAAYIAEAKTRKLPQVFLVDTQGHPRYKGDLPATPADLLTLLTKFGG